MDYLWLGLTIAASLAGIAYNYFVRGVLKDTSRMAEFSWSLTFPRTILFLPAILEISRINWTPYAVYSTIGLAAVTVLNIYQFMKMHSVTELSVSTVIVHLKMVWVPLIAFLLLGEKLAYGSYIGILMIFLATILVSPPKSFVSDSATKQAFLFSLSFSFLAVLQKMVSSFASTQLILLVMSLPMTILLPFTVKNFKSTVFQEWKKDWDKKIIIVLMSISATYLFIAALNRSDTVSDTNAIYQGLSVLGVALGVILLKERKRVAEKLIAGLLVLAGILLLTV
jgi:drug/metabolite transporter (DMT)-like permease